LDDGLSPERRRHKRCVPYQPEQETLADPLDVVDLGFELADEMELATVAVEAIVIAALAVHLGLAARVDSQVRPQVPGCECRDKSRQVNAVKSG